MKDIRNWWEGIAGERYWLGITGGDGAGGVLAAPCTDAGAPGPSRRHLITHVRAGDAIFHYDEARRAIVSWSVAHGRPQHRDLNWSWQAGGGVSAARAHGPIRSWAIGLRRPTPLDRIVTLDEIAPVQSDLFPALRALEDEVGMPLQYPFDMGSRSETRLLAGYVFKLPALFVDQFPALARVAELLPWPDRARARAAGRERARHEPTAASQRPHIESGGVAVAVR